ncbi:hypothetical protein E8E13_009347 [Curvularia kusanoi]|uniref:DUF7918 domain-containing protein n=1 Tax=Curvularia kusanoi TaxID=90978 RepID=A0A9P4WE52_CURKU|nr:hypothetical protein E8E13_009347 [Curvularia kusanoi]
MAIIPAVPGLEVTIEVDNVALPEHQYDDQDAGPIITDSIITYLEVASGSEFSVRWLLKESFEATRATYASVMLDGSYIHAPLRETGDLDGHRGYKYAMAMSEEAGEVFTQKFRFSEIDIDEQPRSMEGIKQQLENIGTINVYLYYVVAETERFNPNVPRSNLSQLDPLNEKISQKCAPTRGDVLTHQASLTVPQLMRSSAFHDVETEPEPFASYTFFYRSTRALKSLGIIPRTPSPSRSPTAEPKAESDLRDPEAMTREELIAALSRFRDQDESHVRVKREREDCSDAAGGGQCDEVVWMGTRPAKKRVHVVLDE